MRFSKKIIVTMFVTVFVFVTVMIVTFFCVGSVPDTLIEQFFAFFGVEGGALAIIKVGETLAEMNQSKKENKESKESKERNEEHESELEAEINEP